jgi:excisionase family DNA binding protein
MMTSMAYLRSAFQEYALCFYVNHVKRSIIVNELLTVSEVAAMLRVDDTTVRRWVKQGALEAVILPHVNERQAYRIKRETLQKIIGEQSENV